jgi:hypothetical protein
VEEHISDNEPLTKFLEDSKDYEVSTGKVKVSAFYPSNKYGAVSVIRILDLMEVEIWDIADQFVAPTRKPKNGNYRARADLATSNVRETGLTVKSETTDHPRHADITGWITPPREVGSEEAIQEIREKKADYAARLFQIAKVVRRELVEKN